MFELGSSGYGPQEMRLVVLLCLYASARAGVISPFPTSPLSNFRMDVIENRLKLFLVFTEHFRRE